MPNMLINPGHPGHKDFAEDTYRTLTARQCDPGYRQRKRVEEQQGNHESLPDADTPIIVFINKMDRRENVSS
jgi:peptide subunit release factor RF-3